MSGRESVKQVLVVRKDLNMRKGKIAAQCAHAAMGAIFRGSVTEISGNKKFKTIELDDDVEFWFNEQFTKICVSVDSEEQLLELEAKAAALGIRRCLIIDSGKTEFNGIPTKTVLAVGPAKSSIVDQITGGLKLL